MNTMEKPIKILFTIPNFDTAGSGKSVYDMVKGLNRSVFEPEICCLHNRGQLYNEVEKLGVKIHLFPFETPYHPLLTFPYRVLKIRNFFKKHQFDIIHSWHWSSDFSEPLAAKLAGIKYVYSKKAMGWGNKAWIWRSKLSSKIVVVNNEMGAAFFKSMPNKIVQIPLCVDIERFKPIPKSFESPEGITTKESDFVIVSVANLVPVKGIELLFEAVGKLNNENIQVIIVGDYDNEYGLQLKSAYKINSNIHFVGKHLDVRPFLAMSDLFVIPTKDSGRREGLPIAPMEAMASGRIVVGSNVTGIREVLKQFPECLFKPDDFNDLANKIQNIINMSINERNQLAKDMRCYVESNLSVRLFIDEHEILYKKLVKS